KWVGSAASLLLNRSLAQLPKQLWDAGAESLLERFRELMTPEAAAAAISDQLCRFELSSPTMRTLDGRLFRLAPASGSGGWRVASADAALVPAGDALRLDYRFRSGWDAPIALTYEFQMPEGVAPSDIH